MVAELLDALLAAPGLGNAKPKFWSKHAKVITAHVRGQPRAQAALLSATPQIHPLGYGGSFDQAFAELWVALVEDAGCIQALAAGELSIDPADFFEHAVDRLGPYLSSVPLRRWLEALAEPLRAGGALRLYIQDKGAQSFDPDLVDLAIALELPVAGPDGLSHPYLHFSEWRLSREAGRPSRDLVQLSRDPRFAALFADMFEGFVADTFHGDAFAAATLSVAGFLPLWRARMVRHLAAMTEGTLLSFERATGEVGSILGPDLFRALPEVGAAIVELDPAALLRRQIAEGVLDEWGWPALDEAWDRLPGRIDHFDQDGLTPHLAVHVPEHTRYVVCGPDGVVHEGPLNVPGSPRRILWVQGRPLITYDHGSLLVGRWGEDPAGETWQSDYLHIGQVGFSLEDGRVTTGGKPIAFGDHPTGSTGGLLTDGIGCWRRRQIDGANTFSPIDPATGKPTEGPIHPFLGRLDAEQLLTVRLLPAFHGDPNPVGAPGATVGFAVVRDPDERHVNAERLDDRRWRGPVPRSSGRPDELVALITFPGRDALHPVFTDEKRNAVQVWTRDAAHPLAISDYPSCYSAGSEQRLDPVWWGMLRPRDPEGSKALRAITLERAQALLQAAVAEGAGELPLHRTFRHEGDSGDRPQVFSRLPGLAPRVAAILPEVTHPRLSAGVAGLAVRAAQLAKTITQWQDALEDLSRLADAPPVAPEDDIADTEVALLRTLLPPGGAYFGTFSLGRQLREVERFFFEDDVAADDIRPVTRSVVAWEALVAGAASVAWRAVSAASADEVARGGLLRVLSLWRRSRFADPAIRARLRRVVARAERFPVPGMTWRSNQRLFAARGGSRYLVRQVDASSSKDKGLSAFELRPADGAFHELLSPTDWGGELRAAPWGTVAQLEALAEAYDTHGALPLDAAIGDEIAQATGLLPASALALWAGAVHRGRFLDADHAKQALGLTCDDMFLARLELDRDLEGVYLDAMPDDPVALWRPLEPDGSGARPVDRLSASWNRRMGKRSPLD